MAIVIISSWAEDARRELAAAVARKLGCPSLSREEVVEQATQAGIPVGKMEIAVMKGNAPKERLARHKSRYLAFTTATVAERARQGHDLVYHGRACHLLLPGVGHVLRVGVVPDLERQVTAVMNRLNLDREKAQRYLDDLNEDMKNWFHFAHGVDPDEPGQYDMVLNLGHLSPESAASAVCSMAQLPDFEPTPASRRALDDLWLGAKARDLLGRDEATAAADLTVTALEGRVTVTYMPRQQEVAPYINRVLAGLTEAREVVCTMALTNLLWVAERFDPASPTFVGITDLAQRWGAGVELLRMASAADEACAPAPGDDAAGAVCRPKALDPTGGIEDDEPALAMSRSGDDGLAQVSDALISRGVFAGSHTSAGNPAEVVLGQVKQQARYSLVIIGDMFAGKGASTRVRQTRELAAAVTERSKVSVITADELQAKFLFGPKQMSRLGIYMAIVVVVYLLAFTFQGPIQDFLAGPDWEGWRVLATAAVVIFVPLVAYLYGGATGLLMKWLKFE
ncbi:MAG: cytidylate kinase-like family protein [Pseudomonadota bacterium]